MATGDAPTQTPASGDEVETLAGDDSARRGRMGLRVPSDAVPPPTAPEGLEPLPDVLGLIGEHTPPAMQAVDGAPTDVNVEVGALTSVSLPPPPPYAAIAYPTAPPSNAAAMRVVRRKIRKLGGDDGETADAAPPASDEAPTAPKLPRVTAEEPRALSSGSPLVVAVSRPPQALAGRPGPEQVKPTPIPSPPVPRVEPIAADDFAVPAVEEVEAQAADPPPPPLALKRSVPPSGEPSPTRELPRRPPSMPPTGFRASIPPPAPADEAPPESAAAGDDDGVELSIEEPRDEEVHRISSPDDILEAPDGAAAQLRNVSIPPPPPPPPTARATGSSRATAVTVVEAKRRRRFWWEELFTDDYFRTVPHLDRDQVRADVDWIEHALGTESGASILDLACGAGLHATELALRRYDVTGVDLSGAMLARAAEAANATGAQVTWSQTDMSQMEFDAAFDAAYCVGTSFGLFDDERNAEVARRLHRALKPHGTFLLQVLNRDHAIQRQPAMAWFEGDACVCMEETSFNFITSRLNVKRTMIFDDGRQREIEYSVRLYSLHEIGQVLHQAGFRILEVSGHPRTPGAFFGASSRELIILAQKRGAEVVEIPQADATQRAPMLDV